MIKISTKKYNKALAIVLLYHKQILKDSDLVRAKEIKQAYKSLDEVEAGDTVICNHVHLASKKHLTKGNKYEVLNTDNYRFLIQCDSGVKKWYHLDNGHFKALK